MRGPGFAVPSPLGGQVSALSLMLRWPSVPLSPQQPGSGKHTSEQDVGTWGFSDLTPCPSGKDPRRVLLEGVPGLWGRQAWAGPCGGGRLEPGHTGLCDSRGEVWPFSLPLVRLGLRAQLSHCADGGPEEWSGGDPESATPWPFFPRDLA